MPAFVDLAGQKYGRWTVLSHEGFNKHNAAMWLCRCECGTEKIITGAGLRSGSSKSCGCLNVDVHRQMCIERNTTHGHAKRDGYSPTYRVWINLAGRKNDKKYEGVTICERWRSFENFLEDMGERPSEKHTIDRIDNSRGYEPDNCRWATMKEQQNNRTNNRMITALGETLTLSQWADRSGFRADTISNRLENGWLPDDAVTVAPVRSRNRHLKNRT